MKHTIPGHEPGMSSQATNTGPIQPRTFLLHLSDTFFAVRLLITIRNKSPTAHSPASPLPRRLRFALSSCDNLEQVRPRPSAVKAEAAKVIAINPTTRTRLFMCAS